MPSPSVPEPKGERAACPRCGHDAADNWFDRSLCPCGDGIGAMHQRCANCGYADDCEFDRLSVSLTAEEPGRG